MTSKTLAKKIAVLALSKKATNVVTMDLRKLSGAADYFVVCTADSEPQVKAIAHAVRDGTDHLGVQLWHLEGLQAMSWVLLDYVDVVLHVFHKDVRSFYNLERLWNDAPIQIVEDRPAAARAVRSSTTAKKAKRPRTSTKRTKRAAVRSSS